MAFQQKVLQVLDCDSLVGGQAIDLAGGGSSRQLAEKKTAPLFALAARAGVIGASLDPVERQAALRFGHEFGVAYQSMDDLADGELRLRTPFEKQMRRTREILGVFGERGAGLKEMLDHLVANRSRKVVVIGSGFGGLGTAVRLASRGYDVELLEARECWAGGLCLQAGWVHVDAGPTVITAPFMIDELFAGAGKRTSDYVKIVPVDPFYRIEFSDGRHLEYNGDEEETERKVAEFSPGDVEGYRAMIRAAKDIFQKAFLNFRMYRS